MAAEKIYKSFTSFINQTINTILSVIKVVVKSTFGLRLPVTKGARCIILANGPSLKKSFEKNAVYFKNHPLICVNTFAVTTEYVMFKPAYYVMLDPFFWEKENEVTASTFKALEQKTDWPVHLLLPKEALNTAVFRNLASKNKNITLTPFNYTVFKGFPRVAHFFYKKNLAMPQSLNVTIAALFIGINLGFKELILVGADHTWHENLHMSHENILHTKVTHFYENDSEIKYVPFYKGGHAHRGTQKAHEFFDIWSRTFYAYMLINDYAISKNCTVYNASEVSFIDAFKRSKI